MQHLNFRFSRPPVPSVLISNTIHVNLYRSICCSNNIMQVTKTEKKNDVVPILKLLFSRVPPGNVQQQYLYSEETDWACEIEPGRSNEGMVERRRTEFLQRSTRLLASYCSNPIPNSRGDELLPLVFRAELYGAQLIGKTF
ncbi:unnamed protein product, partial [Amoebophrya sp. A25]|eukprot:GSA25T00011112001.1